MYLGDLTEDQAPVVAAVDAQQAGNVTLAQQIAAGKALYQGTCSVCHQPDGKGLPNVFPPLAKSDFLMADAERSIGVVLNGLSGPVEVNGAKFDSVMPPMRQLNDDEVANILTFVRNSFGNEGAAITREQVAKVRAGTEAPAGAAH